MKQFEVLITETIEENRRFQVEAEGPEQAAKAACDIWVRNGEGGNNHNTTIEVTDRFYIVHGETIHEFGMEIESNEQN